jgi:hypothetical protein
MIARPSGRSTDLPTLERPAVVLPALPESQELAWHVLLDLDSTEMPWVLVGGQMTLLHCLENGVDGARPTDDGDVVLDVWTHRDAVKSTGQWLKESHDFELTDTSDGYAYRYTRGDATIDLLIPEGQERQRSPARGGRGRPALAVEGGNQALLRVERVPVTVGERSGYVRRPSLLGALVIKAAAYVADSRDKDRHAEDLGLLGQILLDTGQLRTVGEQTTAHDRQRLRVALTNLDAEHRCWRSRPEPSAVHATLTRLAQP